MTATLPDARPAAAAGPERIGPVFWLQQALAAEREAGGVPEFCAPLSGTVRADVCVVGGGFVGLWAALEAVAQAPDATVVLLEAEGCGLGASGRNGGWMTSWHDELDGLVVKFGDAQAAWLAEQSSRAIDRVFEVAGEEGIDCDLRRGGALWGASSAAQLGAWDGPLAAARRVGLRAKMEPVTRAEILERTGTEALLAGARLTDAGAVQPALLARGLRRLALRRGVRIFEGTPMTSLARSGSPVVVGTPGGRVEAESVIVALGAWAARLRELRRAIVPIGSHIVLTEPIPERLEELGWTGGELLGDARMLVHYAQATSDGRIAFGRGGGAIGPLGRVLARHAHDPRTVAIVAADFRRWFPSLADVRLTHAWGGAVDHAPGHLPFVGTIGDREAIHYASGFSGNGVAPSAFVGPILARRALGIVDETTTCALVGDPPGYLPPEPFRTLGGMVVRDAVRRAEQAEELGGRAGRITSALRPLVWFTTPRALEPRRRR